MAFTSTNIPLVHKKVWQPMTPTPIISGAGSCFITDVFEQGNLWLALVNATTHYMYHHDEDAWVQIPSGALAGTFGAGTCGTRMRWSATYTATAWSTTTLTTSTILNGIAKGRTIRFLTGANAGKQSLVTDVYVTPWTNTVITFDALPWAVANTDTFIIDSWLYIILNGGTVAANIFKSYDPLTGIWAALTTTGLPATIGTDAKMVCTPSNEAFATGTATAWAATTLTNGIKSWTTNKRTNFQIRITGGTGIGQVRNIASNTGTVITVSAAWAVTPDVTSTYEITGNDDYLYLLGNGAVTMYRYTRSTNTWATMAPTVARTSTTSTGMSANWACKLWHTGFDDENTGTAGRYIYSFRWGNTSTFDRFDIAGGTAWAGAWQNIVYSWAAEVFNTGAWYALYGKYIYIRKEASAVAPRFFKYSITGNYIEALNTHLYADSTGIIGDRLRVHAYMEWGVAKRAWLYYRRNSGAEVFRLELF